MGEFLFGVEGAEGCRGIRYLEVVLGDLPGSPPSMYFGSFVPPSSPIIGRFMFLEGSVCWQFKALRTVPGSYPEVDP